MSRGDEGAVIECDCAPLSDQLAYTYWAPAVPACDVVITAMVWLDPKVHSNARGALQEAPSTEGANPAGLVVFVVIAPPPPPCCGPRLFEGVWRVVIAILGEKHSEPLESKRSERLAGTEAGGRRLSSK